MKPSASGENLGEGSESWHTSPSKSCKIDINDVTMGDSSGPTTSEENNENLLIEQSEAEQKPAPEDKKKRRSGASIGLFRSLLGQDGESVTVTGSPVQAVRPRRMAAAAARTRFRGGMECYLLDVGDVPHDLKSIIRAESHRFAKRAALKISKKYKRRTRSHSKTPIKRKNISFNKFCSIRVITPRPGYNPEKLSMPSSDEEEIEEAGEKRKKRAAKKTLSSVPLNLTPTSKEKLESLRAKEIENEELHPVVEFNASMIFGDDDEEESKGTAKSNVKRRRRKSILTPTSPNPLKSPTVEPAKSEKKIAEKVVENKPEVPKPKNTRRRSIVIVSPKAVEKTAAPPRRMTRRSQVFAPIFRRSLEKAEVSEKKPELPVTVKEEPDNDFHQACCPLSDDSKQSSSVEEDPGSFSSVPLDFQSCSLSNTQSSDVSMKDEDSFCFRPPYEITDDLLIEFKLLEEPVEVPEESDREGKFPESSLECLTEDVETWKRYLDRRKFEDLSKWLGDSLEPQKCDEVLFSSRNDEILSWLRGWKSRVARQDREAKTSKNKKKKKCEDSDDDYDMEDEKTFQNPLIIHGEAGVGKTALVKALATEMNMKIVELSPDDCRNGNSIRMKMHNAVVSHRVTPAASFFSPVSEKKVNNKQTLVVVEHVDIFFDKADYGAVAALIDATNQAKIPVIWTCERNWPKQTGETHLLTEPLVINMNTSPARLQKYCQIASESILGTKIEDSKMIAFSKSVSHDLRALLHLISFFSLRKDLPLELPNREGISSGWDQKWAEEDLKSKRWNRTVPVSVLPSASAPSSTDPQITKTLQNAWRCLNGRFSKAGISMDVLPFLSFIDHFEGRRQKRNRRRFHRLLDVSCDEKRSRLDSLVL
ncbi:unnamed protein product [Caenorhabditis auriculariae]|uniref:ATPase AAA-type core domain-containing protein n=1 Tax=Caenorhabditis auriculariae TaxID=2777116 RepID=A0A8S1GYX3_9PELO|nr:unnamed protein product [Caenorhabditis auriculariae]